MSGTSRPKASRIARDQPRGQQRVAAEREEVIVNADTVAPEHAAATGPTSRRSISVRGGTAMRGAGAAPAPAAPLDRACRWARRGSAASDTNAPGNERTPATARAAPARRLLVIGWIAGKDRPRAALAGFLFRAIDERTRRAAAHRSAASTSAGSMRMPRIFTCRSHAPVVQQLHRRAAAGPGPGAQPAWRSRDAAPPQVAAAQRAALAAQQIGHHSE